MPSEWTLMFYFASDNPLAPNVVSQLKALKNAGLHHDVNVVAYFDPQTEGMDTHVFDVNMVNKLLHKKEEPKSKSKFWGENDPYIRNLVTDKLWGTDEPFDERIRQHLQKVFRKKGVNYDPPEPPTWSVDEPATAGNKGLKNNTTEPGPKKSLRAFLQFCKKSYKARHYMLFILGHGLVVGNDMFLFDEHGEQDTLSLRDLAEVLDEFKGETGKNKLDLISFHSCSMSSLEVAYELRDTATYMLASQGPAFVGSWPYREIIMRVFNDLIKTDRIKKERLQEDPPTVKSSIEKMFKYILSYSYDFQLAGYSFDLCLCDLREVGQITSPLHALSKLLTTSMEEDIPNVREAVLLAHWDAQSFWQETHTDLYDFCLCLKRRCEGMAQLSTNGTSHLDDIAKKCRAVIAVLEKDEDLLTPSERRNAKGNRLIVRAAFAGPKYQYAHGLSVYFPWSKPTNEFFWNKEYGQYAVTVTTWWQFLNTYFETTQRKPVWKEVEDEFGKTAVPPETDVEMVLDEITCRAFNVDGSLSQLEGKPGGEATAGTGKPGGENPAGSGGESPSIKNYPSYTRDRKRRQQPNRKVKPVSADVLEDTRRLGS